MLVWTLTCLPRNFDALQVDVAFEEVNEIVLLEEGLPYIAGRISEPVQPNLLRMRAMLAASQHNVALVDGMDNVSPFTHGTFTFADRHMTHWPIGTLTHDTLTHDILTH